MQNIMLCPVSITCEIAPEYTDIDEPIIHHEEEHGSTTLLIDQEGDD